MKYKTIDYTFTKACGNKVRGRMYLPIDGKGPFPLVIFSHGFGSNYRELEHYGPMFAEKGYACFLFDFCGGGPDSISDGKMIDMSVLTEAGDLKTCLNMLRTMDYVDENRIALMGESQGAYVSAYVAAHHSDKVSALILWYPAFSISERYREMFENREIPTNHQEWGLPVGERYIRDALSVDIYEEIKSYQKPVLIVHGDRDSVVPIEVSRKALQTFAKARLRVIEGAEHGFNGKECYDAFQASLDYLRKKSKCIFMDADGTILDVKNGLGKDIASAVRRLHANGHKVFLCTGRSRAFIPQEVEMLGLDGMITNLGAYMEYEGRTVYAKQLDTEDAYRALCVLRENGMVPVMEGNDRMYFDKEEYTEEVDWYAPFISEVLESVSRTETGWEPIRGNEHSLRINKISAKRRPGSNVEKATEALSDIFDFIYHEGAFVGDTVECIAKGHSKGLSMAILAGVLGYDKKDIVAIGDSNNDLSMFEVAGICVAMGDGSAELKAKADLVTDTLDNKGISKALKQLGLI